MRELRDREGEINTLYRQLQTISRALDEARGLLDKKLTVLDVHDYLNQCKVCAHKLIQCTNNMPVAILYCCYRVHWQ